MVNIAVARDGVDRGEALMAGRVGEPKPADDVSDGVDVWLLGPHPAVDLDHPAIGLDLGRLETDVLDVGGAAGGHEHQLGAELGWFLALWADHQADAVVVGGHGCGVESRVGHDGHPALGEVALDDLADVDVIERDDLGQVLDQGHLRAQVVEHAGELAADRARADDDDVLRQGIHLQDVVAGDDPNPVRGQTGQRLHAGTRGEDDVGRVQGALATAARGPVIAGLADLDLARAVEPAATWDPGDLVLVDERLEPGPQAFDDGVAPGGHRRVVDRRLTGEDQAVVLGVVDPVREVRRFEERLGRDATAMEARATDLVVVDEGDLEPELTGAEGRRVTAGPRAEHDEIEVVGGSDSHGIKVPRSATRPPGRVGWADGSSLRWYARGRETR